MYSFQKLNNMLQKALADGVFPGAAAAICDSDNIIWNWVGGVRQKTPITLPLFADTAFDLASLTKVVCTTLCATRLYEKDILDFDASLNAYLPDAGNFAQSTVRQILTHTAGFIAEERLCNKVLTPQEALGYILRSSPSYDAGTKTEYSCFGFIVLGKILTLLSGKSLDRLCKEEVSDPLKMYNTRFIPSEQRKNEISQTNYQNLTFAATEYDEKTGHMLCGTVHDENARFLGGIAGNAGLFSTLEDLTKLVQMLLKKGLLPNGTPYLTEETTKLLCTDFTPELEEARGLGFKLASRASEQFAGTKLSRYSFGHTGFTGTSVLIDPERKLGIILLTNRVHPSRKENRLLDFRGRFHDAVAECAESL